MRSIEQRSPAKINLFLDVLGRRDDGYHDIVTVFEKIDLCDIIRLSESGEDIKITSNVEELVLGEDNLAYRACSLLKESYGISNGVKIHIEKKITSPRALNNDLLIEKTTKSKKMRFLT